MIELEKEFIGIGEVKGFKFEQLQKSDYAYMYKVSSSGESEHNKKVGMRFLKENHLKN